ncbi:unnamed protein product [marine sediment metagenome]|uniref:Helix-turn-helix type 11 domain-containing protein n=1 Tax=marine sediment metagenome TaxID=412755 RepID=X1DK54_9ZZZZ
MSQEEVIGVLKKHCGEWLTGKEIARILNQQTSAIYSALRKLREWSEIQWQRMHKEGGWQYGYKDK